MGFFFTGNIEGLEIVERKSPGGFSQKYIIIDGNYHLLEFFQSGFIPDPRTHFPELRNMEVFDNDILIAAFLKCGKFNKIHDLNCVYTV